MAELNSVSRHHEDSQTISLDYSDPARQSLLTTLRMSIVLWGLVPAVVSAFGFINLMISAFTRETSNYLHNWALTSIGLIIPTLVLIAIRNLSKSSLLIDKNGLEIPPDLLSTRLKTQYIPWPTINKVVFQHSETARQKNTDSPLANDQIVLYLKQQKPVVVKLNRLDIASCEKLLVCFDVFAGRVERESLETLSNLIKIQSVLLTSTVNKTQK